ncbi:hypothetical protein ARMSODRAFT_1019387 [Armillaria solidipes]|uniref:Uncharacterized protein n=1 Tax=Armillaria solidipes TaxID=1076256 RepID=A0A2H3BY30_9AGAR|nr:hypothetical protein ARMSODRAFT_1019387 [Armillaria solidipes]
MAPRTSKAMLDPGMLRKDAEIDDELALLWFLMERSKRTRTKKGLKSEMSRRKGRDGEEVGKEALDLKPIRTRRSFTAADKASSVLSLKIFHIRITTKFLKNRDAIVWCTELVRKSVLTLKLLCAMRARAGFFAN